MVFGEFYSSGRTIPHHAYNEFRDPAPAASDLAFELSLMLQVDITTNGQASPFSTAMCRELTTTAVLRAKSSWLGSQARTGCDGPFVIVGAPRQCAAPLMTAEDGLVNYLPQMHEHLQYALFKYQQRERTYRLV